MKQFVAIVIFALCSVAVSAQSSKTGSGSVSVKQSAEIDELVFGKKKKATKSKEQIKAEKKEAKKAAKEEERRKKDEESRRSAESNPRPTSPQRPQLTVPVAARHNVPDINLAPRRESTTSQQEEKPKTKIVRRQVIRPDGTPSTRTVLKKVVKKGMKKVSGYRVQVYSGGNTRIDKQKAEQAGHKIKAAFPEQPVYVHFYSPRWICRVGNFTDKNKAAAMLKKVKALGFSGAIVVSGQITVRNKEYYDIE